MKLLSAEFVTSAAAASRLEGIPRDGLCQIALAGRSNVGKSSLINALCRLTIARTSAAPGKTRLANVYRVSFAGGPRGPGRWSVYLVDLPGYGYARGGAAAATELSAVAEGYFAARGSGFGARGSLGSERTAGSRTPDPGPRHAAEQRSAALLLIDARHPRLESDLAASSWLASIGVDRHVIATKIDKLSRAERTRNLNTMETTFGTAALPVSAVSGEGLDALWKTIATIAENR